MKAKSSPSRRKAPRALSTFEITLAGFDASTDVTDDLVKWVNAPSLRAVRAFVKRCALPLNNGPHLLSLPIESMPVPFGDGVDIEIVANGMPIKGTTQDWKNQINQAVAKVTELRAKQTERAAPTKVETPKLWTCMISNEPGETVTVHQTEAGAYAEAFGYVKDQWESECGDEPMPKDQHTAIAAYFSAPSVEGRESCDIKPATLRA